MSKKPTISRIKPVEQKPATSNPIKIEVLDNLFQSYAERPRTETAQRFVAIMKEINLNPSLFKKFSNVVLGRDLVKKGLSFTKIMLEIMHHEQKTHSLAV